MSLTLNDIQNALTRVHAFIQPTPMQRSEKLEKELNFAGNIFFQMRE